MRVQLASQAESDFLDQLKLLNELPKKRMKNKYSSSSILQIDIAKNHNLAKEAIKYNNKGVRFIYGAHLAIIGPSEARTDLMAREGLQLNVTPEK